MLQDHKTKNSKQKTRPHTIASIYSLCSFIKQTQTINTLYPRWVTLIWLQRLNAIYRLYAMALSRYEWGFDVSPKLFNPWNVFIPRNTNTFGKLLANHIYFFRAHIDKNWWGLFQNSDMQELLPNPIYFSELMKIHTDIFRELLSNYTHTFQSSYILTFSEFMWKNKYF